MCTGGGNIGARVQRAPSVFQDLKLILGKGASESQGPLRHSKTTTMTRVCATFSIDSAMPVIT